MNLSARVIRACSGDLRNCKMTAHNKGRIYVFLAVAMMSTGGLFIKSIEASAITIAFGRCVIAGLLFLPSLVMTLKSRKIRFSKDLFLLCFFYVWLCLAFVTSTKLTTAANAIILQSSAPLWLYLYYIFFKHRKVVLKELIPRLIILIGIVIIFFGTGSTDFTVQELLGNLIALSAGIAYALEQHMLEKNYGISDNSTMCILNLAMAVTILVVFGWSLDFSTISATGWVYLLLLGIFQIGIAYVIFIKGVRLVSAMEASVLSLLEPILNPILVFIFVGEVPSTFTIIGFFFIFLGIVVTMFSGNKDNQIEKTNSD